MFSGEPYLVFQLEIFKKAYYWAGEVEAEVNYVVYPEFILF